MLPKSYKILWEHIPLALGNGVFFSIFYENWICFGVAMLLGWLVDADHLFDFLICVYEKKIKLNWHVFLQGEYFRKSQRVILPLHAFEWPIILLIASLSSFISDEFKVILICGGISLFFHLVQDQITNNVRPMGYFIIFRFLKRFDISSVCK